MDASILAGFAGIVLSLAFAYVPGLQKWFNGLDGTYKRLINLGALLLVSAGAYLFSCVGWFGAPVPCDQVGLEGLVTAFFAAAVTNQGTYLMTTASSASRKHK